MPKGVYDRSKAKKRKDAGVPRSPLKMFELDNMPAEKLTQETDSQIARKLRDRFEVLEVMTQAALSGDINSLIVSGPAGLGKSYTVEKCLEEWDPQEKKHTVIRGYVKATGLFKTLFQYRNKGQVIVFDDSDSLFLDDSTLAMLKAVCDSTDRRRVSYLAEFNMVDERTAQVIPRQFQFDGTIVFISNLDFDAIAEKGGKLAPHLQAMISRSHYIDLAMKTRRDYIIRMKQVIKEGLLSKRGLSKSQERKVVRFIDTHQNYVREFSLRIAIKLGDLVKRNERTFEKMAKVTCCKGL